jgi:hypothetical protein
LTVDKNLSGHNRSPGALTADEPSLFNKHQIQSVFFGRHESLMGIAIAGYYLSLA